MNNEFGKRLKHIRESRNMSQDELANLLGTSKQVISRYETAQRTPKITTVYEYAQKLGVSIEQLTGYTVDRAFDGTPYEGMNRDQVSLLLFAEFLGRIDEKYPNISDKDKAALIFEYNKHDPVDVLLSTFSETLSNSKKESREGEK